MLFVVNPIDPQWCFDEVNSSLKRFLVGPLLTEMESIYDVEIRWAGAVLTL